MGAEEQSGGAVAAAIARACARGADGTALLEAGSAVLVACSGGADSAALAAALVEHAQREPAMRLRVALGHVDHGLREESAREAAAVRALAERLGVPFLLERLEGAPLRAQIARDGLEGAARSSRYAALERLALQGGCGVVATGHTRRDQAETVLLRLARGGGLGALAGVRASRALGGVRLVRPLLEVPRAATEEFCAARTILYTNDPHNRDPLRARARLRKAFAELESLLSPRLEEALAGSARIAAEEDALLDRLARDALAAAGGTLRLEALAPLPDALLRRALLIVARAAGGRPERVHLDRLCALVRRGSGALDLPGARARAADGALELHPYAPPDVQLPAPPAVSISGPGRVEWGALALEISPPGETPPGALRIDPARAPFPWTLRAHAPGDRFRPRRGHLKKVGELWIDAQLPRAQRGSQPLLADARGTLFYVGGLRPGDAADPANPMSVSLRFLPAARASFSTQPALVEQRAANPRANILASIDEETR